MKNDRSKKNNQHEQEHCRGNRNMCVKQMYKGAWPSKQGANNPGVRNQRWKSVEVALYTMCSITTFLYTQIWGIIKKSQKY